MHGRRGYESTAYGFEGLGYFSQPLKRPGVTSRTLQSDVEDARRFTRGDIVRSLADERAKVTGVDLSTGKLKVEYLEGKLKGRECSCKPSFFTIIEKAPNDSKK